MAESNPELPRKRDRDTSSPTRPATSNKKANTDKSWSHNEIAALLDVLVRHKEQESSEVEWPSSAKLWGKVAINVCAASGGNAKRSAAACRLQAARLQDQYLTVAKALKAVKGTSTRSVCVQTETETQDCSCQATIAKETVAIQHSTNLEDESNKVLVDKCTTMIRILLRRRKVKGPPTVKETGQFVHNIVDAVCNCSGRYNILYGVAAAVVRNKATNKKQVLPFGRMPYDMIEYQIKFVNGGWQSSPHCSPAYFSFLDTMYTQFGNRFFRQFRGPYYEGVAPKEQYPYNCKFNVACIGTGTILERRKRMEENNSNLFSKDTSIQMHSQYLERLGRYSNIRNSEDLAASEGHLKQDLEHLKNGLQKAEEDFNDKCQKPTTSKNKLKEKCWAVHEHSVLVEQVQEMITTFQSFSKQLAQGHNIQGGLKELKEDYYNMMRNVYRLKRVAATHVLVFSIAHEERRKKPYSVPCRYIAYTSITDSKLRELVGEIAAAMISVGLVPVGSCTDGEFNTCRTIGIDGQPTSIFRMLQMAKTEVNCMKEEELLQLLLTDKIDNGKYVPINRNEFVPQDTLMKVEQLNQAGVSLEAILATIRRSLLPDGIQMVPWPNCSNRITEALRTIVCTFKYRHYIEEAVRKGRDHRIYAYIPEFNPATGDFFYDFEDHHHVLKRVGFSTRNGGPPHLDFSCLSEVLADPYSGLTEPALRGDHKQSVREAELLLSYKVASSLSRLGYVGEGRYVQTIAKWHEASDGRAMKTTNFQSVPAKQRARSTANYGMLNYLLDDYMPWHINHYDFRLIDINRPLKGVCGMTRETIIAIFTNIEGAEHRRQQLHLLPAHPRSYDTNDCELLFSVFREHNGGLAYTLKCFQNTWAPLCSEFMKQLDDDLPFHYETTNQRFKSGSLEAPESTFDKVDDGNPLRLHTLKPRVRDSPATFIAGRASCPVSGRLSARTDYHKSVSDLPSVVVGGHDYV